MKKITFLILIIIFALENSNAQTKKDLYYSIKALEIKIQNLEKRVDELKVENNQLRSEIISISNNVNNQIKNNNNSNQAQPNNSNVNEINKNKNTNSTQEKKIPVSNSRCQATTKKGSQCLRSAQQGRSYCWQH